MLARLAQGYPLAALGLTFLLGWRFHRSRVVWGALALAAVHLLLGPGAFGDRDVAHWVALTLVPLLLGTLALGRDRPVISARGFFQAGVALVVAGAGLLVVYLLPADVGGRLGSGLGGSRLTASIGLEPPVLATALLGFAAVVGAGLMRRRPGEAGLAWALLAGVLALLHPAGSVAGGVWMLAAGLVLAFTVVESSYAMAFHDDLTGLPGRRALDDALASLRPPFAVAVVDVDHFKQVNDRHGHEVGDQVLRMVATKLAGVGGGGRAFRSGGEEFTVLFPGLTEEQARPHAEELRKAVANAAFILRGRFRPPGRWGVARRGRKPGAGKRVRVTVSVGLASGSGRDQSVDEVVRSADRRLYRAKSGGRDRVA